MKRIDRRENRGREKETIEIEIEGAREIGGEIEEEIVREVKRQERE